MRNDSVKMSAAAGVPVDIPKLSEWHGYFFGHDLDFLHAELLAIQHVPATLLRKEPDLMRVKWFDYRRMHPTTATYLCAHNYNRAYQDCMTVMKDQSGRYMRGFKGLDFMDSFERKSFWRLRQGIDRLGMRYDFFLRKAMNWHIQAGWLRPPRPAHLMTNTDMLVDVMLAWEEECAAKLQFPKDTRYKARNFFGHIDQLDWENWIVGQIAQRRHPQYGLHAALYIERTLRIEKAIECFDERVVLEAISETGVT